MSKPTHEITSDMSLIEAVAKCPAFKDMTPDQQETMYELQMFAVEMAASNDDNIATEKTTDIQKSEHKPTVITEETKEPAKSSLKQSATETTVVPEQLLIDRQQDVAVQESTINFLHKVIADTENEVVAVIEKQKKVEEPIEPTVKKEAKKPVVQKPSEEIFKRRTEDESKETVPTISEDADVELPVKTTDYTEVTTETPIEESAVAVPPSEEIVSASAAIQAVEIVEINIDDQEANELHKIVVVPAVSSEFEEAADLPEIQEVVMEPDIDTINLEPETLVTHELDTDIMSEQFELPQLVTIEPEDLILPHVVEVDSQEPVTAEATNDVLEAAPVAETVMTEAEIVEEVEVLVAQAIEIIAAAADITESASLEGSTDLNEVLDEIVVLMHEVHTIEEQEKLTQVISQIKRELLTHLQTEQVDTKELGTRESKYSVKVVNSLASLFDDVHSALGSVVLLASRKSLST